MGDNKDHIGKPGWHKVISALLEGLTTVIIGSSEVLGLYLLPALKNTSKVFQRLHTSL